MKIFAQPGGKAGIRFALAKMRGLVYRAQIHPLIRQQAFLATSGCPVRDMVCKAYAIQGWVQAHLRFVHDPVDFEHITPPEAIAVALHEGRQPFEDCESFVTYMAALMKAIGLRPYFRIVGQSEQTGFHHVMIHVLGINLDPSHPPWETPMLPPPGISELYAA